MTMTDSDEKLLAKIKAQAEIVSKRQVVFDTTKKAQSEAKAELDGAVGELLKLTGASKEDLPLAEMGEADGWKKLKLANVLIEKHALMLKKVKGWRLVGELASFLTKKPLTEVNGIGPAVSAEVTAAVTRRIHRNGVWKQNWDNLGLHL